MTMKVWDTFFIKPLERFWRFIKFVIYHFFEDDCPYRASALAFTTLLAIVPLMTVGLSILSSFPVFQGFIAPIQNFIFDNFVPTTGKIVQNYLQQFALQVSRLPVWGILFLIGTAILVMVTIERAMNKIWRVNCPRRGAAAFLLYWAILSLAPVFLALSLAASSYLFSLSLRNSPLIPFFLLHYLPFLLSLTGFTFLYVVVPNRAIKLSDGFFGALVATLLFESAKQAFAFYLTHYNTYQLLYGAFATVPLFFIWIYWVWIITLLGAEISYALSVHHQRRSGQPLPGFVHALVWCKKLWQNYQLGRGTTLEELISTSDRPYFVDVGDMAQLLQQINLIHTDEKGRYFLSRDLREISLYWLSLQLPYRLPTGDESRAEECIDANWCQIFTQAEKALTDTLAIKLSEFL